MKAILGIVALLVAAAPAPAFAEIVVFTGAFSGANENPPNASTGSGAAAVTLDTIAQTLEVDLTFDGLIGTTTVAHLHCCALTNANAGVAVAPGTFIGFPAGVTSGSYNFTYDLTNSATFNPSFVTSNGGTLAAAAAALIAGLMDGLVYANIHTTSFAGGELRANLSEVPLPAAMWLFLAGAGALAMRRRA